LDNEKTNTNYYLPSDGHIHSHTAIYTAPDIRLPRGKVVIRSIAESRFKDVQVWTTQKALDDLNSTISQAESELTELRKKYPRPILHKTILPENSEMWLQANICQSFR